MPLWAHTSSHIALSFYRNGSKRGAFALQSEVPLVVTHCFFSSERHSRLVSKIQADQSTSTAVQCFLLRDLVEGPMRSTIGGLHRSTRWFAWTNRLLSKGYIAASTLFVASLFMKLGEAVPTESGISSSTSGRTSGGRGISWRGAISWALL